MKINYDGPKRLSNIERHGLDFAELTIDFFIACKVEETRAGRFKAVGDFQGRSIIAVVFRPLGSEALSVISMLQASKAERTAL